MTAVITKTECADISHLILLSCLMEEPIAVSFRGLNYKCIFGSGHIIAWQCT